MEILLFSSTFVKKKKNKPPKGFAPSVIEKIGYKHLSLDFYEVKWSQLVYNLKFNY